MPGCSVRELSMYLRCSLPCLLLLPIISSGCRNPKPGTVCYPGEDFCRRRDGCKVDRTTFLPLYVDENGNCCDQPCADEPPRPPPCPECCPECCAECAECPDCPGPVEPTHCQECVATAGVDDDADCIEDRKEPPANVGSPDADGDGVLDGCEDRNWNGVVDPSETDPSNPDSDGDGIADGVEDANHNGRWDPGEMNPRDADTDGDGISDGVEDANGDGHWNRGDDGGDGCHDPGDVAGESNPTTPDTDGDQIPDGVEDANGNGLHDPGETYAWHRDTDCDGLGDGKEDLSHDGIFNRGETDPFDADTDDDGLPDGIEDANGNGRWDAGFETDPLIPDSDGDGIRDGTEDKNHDGVVGSYTDTDGDGCFDEGEGGESDPRRADTDGDGIEDRFEDKGQDGECDWEDRPDPDNPGQTIRRLVESCAFVIDSDCDGLADGVEDRTHNGQKDAGETDPTHVDTDRDGLYDGCPAWATDQSLCEDRNNNGVVDADESNPAVADSDGDGLPDGCEVGFDQANCAAPPCAGLDPRKEDTDGDGETDGDEDANHNCRVDDGETDPRVADPEPDPGPDFAQFQVCSVKNLKQLTFAEASRPTHDYRVAFEVEKGATDTACAVAADCGQGESCEPRGDQGNVCFAQSSYADNTIAIGRDDNGDGVFQPEEELWGHVFQSAKGVPNDPSRPTVLLNRDVHGFVVVEQNDAGLDTILDDIRETLRDPSSGYGSVYEFPTTVGQDAHDNVPDRFRVKRAQRHYTLTLPSGAPVSAVGLRNDLLQSIFLPRAGRQGTPDPSHAVSGEDLVYGPIDCPGDLQNCHQVFDLQIAAVQRLDQEGGNGRPGVVIFVVALTYDDSDPDNPGAADRNRRFYDRRTRLEDLTGGSAVARFEAETTKGCESMPPAMAQADLLWVVDDSRSMQQMIGRLQRAASDAREVLTANSGIVDFRVAMTTTNPSAGSRTQCWEQCNAACLGIAAQHQSFCNTSCATQLFGCIKVCPPGCQQGCSGGICTCDPATCAFECGDIDPVTAGRQCYEPSAANIEALVTADIADHPLAGGGGTFYYEDPEQLNCNSTAGTGQASFIVPCTGQYDAQFSSFMAAGPLTDHAGFLGSSDEVCQAADMNLRANPLSQPSCSTNTDSCCQRLIASCDDGPTVLASQMCDLIRAMGGLPELVGGQQTSGARPHSAPEHGSRAARRLITSMLPALPSGWPASGTAYDPRQQLRLRCAYGDPGCEPCDPRTSESCDIVPLVSLFLSDEEDFWLKDDCEDTQRSADKRPLPSACHHVGGTPSDDPQSCIVDADDPLSYCRSLDAFSAAPDGYDPDQSAWDRYLSSSLRWRDTDAPQCDPLEVDSCIADPCPGVPKSLCGCKEGSTCDPEVGADPAAPLYDFCYWERHQCYNRCALHALATPAAGERWETAAARAEHDCDTDEQCRWEQALVESEDSFRDACVAKIPRNDCQACKRLRRTLAAFEGGDLGPDGTPLVGFADVGPVYAVVRDAGTQGFGTPHKPDGLPEDECQGGSVTWGRGDGQAYRDLATLTLGRTQNVCADTYRDFMQVLLTDIAALSRPYPLQGKPIAATIKVGIGRQTAGGWEYHEVPRSSTSGFFYDPSYNTIGFKTEDRDAPHVPREGDMIYVSYRLWRPVPCEQQCQPGELCVRLLCSDEGDGYTCPGGTDTECPCGYTCTAGACLRYCTPGDLIDCCEPPACGLCEVYNPDSGLCEPIGDLCACNPGIGDACAPQAANSCGFGRVCDETTCLCASVPGCQSGFRPDGTVINCDAAIACCVSWAEAAAACLARDEGSCGSGEAADCGWDPGLGQCVYRYGDVCCAEGQEIACLSDPETGRNVMYCEAGACECPVCPPGEICCITCGAGCECIENPN